MKQPIFSSSFVPIRDWLSYKIDVPIVQRGDDLDEDVFIRLPGVDAPEHTVVIRGFPAIHHVSGYLPVVVRHPVYGLAVLSLEPEEDDLYSVLWSEMDEWKRPQSGLEGILGMVFPVLDQGFVRVVDYMGDDAAIVQAARISYGCGTKRVQDDENLIRYLMRHRHTSPFEMCEIKLHVRVPMDCWRQWIRHRMANVNEYSTRYSGAIDAAQRTYPDQWRLQSLGNKQGSSGYLPADPSAHGPDWACEVHFHHESDGKCTCPINGAALTAREIDFQNRARRIYEERLLAGVAREQARKDLPLSTYTEAYWKIDLHNLFHFLNLRMDSHAQEEIRAYAVVIGEIVAQWVPMAWAAFRDYRWNSLTLSAHDMALVRFIGGGCLTEAEELACQLGWIAKSEVAAGGFVLLSNRERSEFEEKCHRLGWLAPWEEPSHE